jgi:hypothetical protein
LGKRLKKCGARRLARVGRRLAQCCESACCPLVPNPWAPDYPTVPATAFNYNARLTRSAVYVPEPSASDLVTVTTAQGDAFSDTCWGNVQGVRFNTGARFRIKTTRTTGAFTEVTDNTGTSTQLVSGPGLGTDAPAQFVSRFTNADGQTTTTSRAGSLALAVTDGQGFPALMPTGQVLSNIFFSGLSRSDGRQWAVELTARPVIGEPVGFGVANRAVWDVYNLLGNVGDRNRTSGTVTTESETRTVSFERRWSLNADGQFQFSASGTITVVVQPSPGNPLPTTETTEFDWLLGGSLILTPCSSGPTPITPIGDVITRIRTGTGGTRARF